MKENIYIVFKSTIVLDYQDLDILMKINYQGKYRQHLEIHFIGMQTFREKYIDKVFTTHKKITILLRKVFLSHKLYFEFFILIYVDLRICIS